MEFIDKTQGKAEADQRIEAFLQSLNGNYPSDLYEALRAKTIVKNGLVKQLLRENNNRCCYCMREIGGASLEHVIPQSTKDQNQYNQYFTLDSELKNADIVLESAFLQNPTTVPPYPHTIAYENLIPSCLGTFASKESKCCNNKRGNRFIHPLIFRNTIAREIVYKENGSVIWRDEPDDNSPQAMPTITTLGLDCAELKVIRRIWCYLAQHNLSYDANREEVIYNLIFQPSNSEEEELLNVLLNFERDDYWNLLAKYSYFNDASKFTP